MAQRIVDELITSAPAFHREGDEPQVWNARAQTLAYIAGAVRSGDRTAETGVGASTVAFVAAGAVHTAISPVVDEHDAVRGYCVDRGLSIDRLELIEGYSEAILPTFYPQHGLDVAFIDGKHSFPHPIVDWHYLATIVRLDGLVVLDDLAAPAVEMICRAVLSDPCWSLDAALDGQAVAFRKLAHPPAGDPWRDQHVASAQELERRLLRAAPHQPRVRRAETAPRRLRAVRRRLTRALRAVDADVERGE